MAALLALLLGGCSTPPLTRSVVVQRNAQGVPVHARGHVRRRDYIVAKGDTLYSIAFRVGADYRDLARWNGIDAPYVIYPGQRLRTTAPSRQATGPQPAPRRSAPASQPAAQAPVFRPVQSATSGVAGSAVPDASGDSTATTKVAVAGDAQPATPAGAKEKTPPPAPPQHIASAPTHVAGGIDWRWPVSGAVIKGYDAHDAIPGLTLAGKRGEPVHAAASGTVVYSGNGLVGYGELIIIKHSDSYLSAYGHNSRRLVKEGQQVKAGQVIAAMGSSGAPRDELEFQIRHNGKPVDPSSYLPGR